MWNLKILFFVLTLWAYCVITGCFFTGYKAIQPGLLSQPLKIVDFTDTIWPLRAWMPVIAKSDTLKIYIEGDGRAWLQRNQPSSDPTPKGNLVHNLLVQDQNPDVAYIGQPCQYIMQPPCDFNIWTFGRYSQEALSSMNQAIDSMKKTHNYQKLELVGYSGGGVMALLLAAYRSDVVSIVTVAGNLVPSFTNSLHQVSVIPGALNPLKFADKLSKIPQIHFIGSQDEIIPIDISDYYATHMPDLDCTQVITVNASHARGWVESWQTLLLHAPKCKTKNYK